MPSGGDAEGRQGLADRAEKGIQDDGLRGLSAQAAMHGGAATLDHARLSRGRATGDARTHRLRSKVDENQAVRRRASVRHAQVDDGLASLPGPRIEEGESRVRAGGLGLQYEASDQDPRRRADDPGPHGRLIALTWPSPLLARDDGRENQSREFSHGLFGEDDA